MKLKELRAVISDELAGNMVVSERGDNDDPSKDRRIGEGCPEGLADRKVGQIIPIGRAKPYGPYRLLVVIEKENNKESK